MCPAWRYIGPICGTPDLPSQQAADPIWPAPGRPAGSARRRSETVGVLRLSHVDITVTDLDLACAYYTKVIGMIEVERTADSVYLKCWDEIDHHSLRLTYAPRVGFDLMSFKVTSDDDLSQLENAEARYGLPVRPLRPGDSVRQGVSIRFLTPTGHTLELVHALRMLGSSPPRAPP